MSPVHHGGVGFEQRNGSVAAPLLSTLALLEREAARRAKGTHPGMMRLQDDDLVALLDVLRREVGTVAGLAREAGR